MADEITNRVLLEHMQGMKNDLQQQISSLDVKVTGLEQKLTQLAHKVDEGFEDARRHRQALQEDLEETMKVQGRDATKLARL